MWQLIFLDGIFHFFHKIFLQALDATEQSNILNTPILQKSVIISGIRSIKKLIYHTEEHRKQNSLKDVTAPWYFYISSDLMPYVLVCIELQIVCCISTENETALNICHASTVLFYICHHQELSAEYLKENDVIQPTQLNSYMTKITLK